MSAYLLCRRRWFSRRRRATISRSGAIVSSNRVPSSASVSQPRLAIRADGSLKFRDCSARGLHSQKLYLCSRNLDEKQGGSSPSEDPQPGCRGCLVAESMTTRDAPRPALAGTPQDELFAQFTAERDCDTHMSTVRSRIVAPASSSCRRKPPCLIGRTALARK